MNQEPIIPIRCPWIEDHSCDSGSSETVYFPAGTGSFECGHFKCLHASHAGKTDADFLGAIGFFTDGFEDISHPSDAAHPAIFSADVAANPPLPAPTDAPRFERDLKSGKIKPLIQNVVAALRSPEWCGLRLSYDTFKDAILIGEPGATREFGNEDYTELTLTLVKKGFGPGPLGPQVMRDAVAYNARERAFDSAIDWLRGLEAWDRTPRVDRFCADYLGADASPYATAVSRYWWSAHAGRVLEPGVQADMAIVLISSQGTGKTSTIQTMVPSPNEYVELSLSERDSDLCRVMRGKLIGELAELRGIVSRDMEAIKAWVSCRRDAWTPKYKEFAHTLPRRIVLVGTSNQEEFLADETGNRRWLPLHVGEKQSIEAIEADRTQLWAEALYIFEHEGVCWKEAETLARAEHYKFQVQDPWSHTIKTWLEQPPSLNFEPLAKGYLTATEVLRECMMIDPSRQNPRDLQRVAKALVSQGFTKHQKRVGGILIRVWKNEELENLL